MASKNEYPALVITEGIPLLCDTLRNSGIPVNMVTDPAKDLPMILDRYTGIVVDIPVVIADLSTFKNYHSKLLKFIEESKSPVICLSRVDCFSQVFLSRFKTIKKTPVIHVKKVDNLRYIKEDFLEGEFTWEKVIECAVSYYPMLYTLGKSDIPCKEKIRQFFV